MIKIKAPKFLGKICKVNNVGSIFHGQVCMPTGMSFDGDYSYSCLRIDFKNKTVYIEDEFAWVDEENLILLPTLTDLSGFQFTSDEVEE